jgi:ferredoxin
MKKVCAWCGKDMVEVGDEGSDTRFISHGICETCLHYELAQLGMSLSRFIEGLDEPVVVVDSYDKVKTANSKALELVAKDLQDVEGNSGGLVFGCEHALLPGGCGNSVHCSACAIRIAVSETHATGQGLLRVPATLLLHSPVNPQEIRFLITTEKVKDVVLLRIDEVSPSVSAS